MPSVDKASGAIIAMKIEMWPMRYLSRGQTDVKGEKVI